MIWIVAIDRNFLAEWILFRPLEKSSVFDAVLRQPRCMSYGAKREVDLWAFAVDGGREKERRQTSQTKNLFNFFVTSFAISWTTLSSFTPLSDHCHQIIKKIFPYLLNADVLNFGFLLQIYYFLI